MQAGLPAITLALLQRVPHAAVRLANDLRPHDPVRQALNELHWLPMPQRIEYKLCLLVRKSLTGHIPVYICRLLIAVADVPSWSALRDSNKGNFVVPRTRLKLDDRFFFCCCS